MSTREIEKRLTAVEQEFARLKAADRRAEAVHPVQSLESIHGTFEDDKAVQEAARLGRKSMFNAPKERHGISVRQ